MLQVCHPGILASVHVGEPAAEPLFFRLPARKSCLVYFHAIMGLNQAQAVRTRVLVSASADRTGRFRRNFISL